MATYAGRYSENLQDRYGNGYRNALVAVETTSGDPVTLYADRTKTAYVPASGLAANEIKADSRGNLIFYSDPGNYQIVVTPVGGFTLAAFPVSVLPDPLEPDASEGALQAEEDARIAGDALKLDKAANLGDVASAATSRDNLGLGDAATQNAADLPVSTAQAIAIRQGKFPQAIGAVVLSWDDSSKFWASVLLPRLIARGQRNTFFVTSDFIGADANKATAAEMVALLGAGNEIGSHSKSHPTMTAITAAQRAVEADASKAAIEAIIGVGLCTTWAYPFGRVGRSEATDRELYLRYDRLANAGNEDGVSLVPMEDRGAFLQPRTTAWNSATHQNVLALIRAAANRPVLACIFGHIPGTDMTVSELEEALDLIDALGIPTLTYTEAFPSHPTLRNPGFEDGLTGWIAVKSSVDQVVEVVTDAPATGFPGTKSLRIATASDTGWAYAAQAVRIVPGVTYAFSGRYRVNTSAGAGYVSFRVQPEDRNGTALRGPVNGVVASTTWAQGVTEFTAGPLEVQARLDCILFQRLGEAFFDHIHFGPKALGIQG